MKSDSLSKNVHDIFACLGTSKPFKTSGPQNHFVQVPLWQLSDNDFLSPPNSPLHSRNSADMMVDDANCNLWSQKSSDSNATWLANLTVPGGPVEHMRTGRPDVKKLKTPKERAPIAAYMDQTLRLVSISLSSPPNHFELKPYLTL